MSLISIWKNSREEFQAKRLHQIISIAGDGRLSDNGSTCQEFREFLSIIPSSYLSRFSQECLEGFDQSGLALQDLVNEIGVRLGFRVQSGRYRGRAGEIGFDGLWQLKSSHHIIVEVKTTDAYAINLDTIANYRRRLVADGLAQSDKSSILLVVGRQDTGGLEAQIRGSRFAWDMRIISVDSLLRLLELKEAMDDPKQVDKISEILVPQEFTRLDRIIDVVFSTAEEAASIDEVDETESDEEEEAPRTGAERVAKFHPVAFHEECVVQAATILNGSFIKESRSIYIDKEKDMRLWVSVSKQHGGEDRQTYWFALHPHQREALEAAKDSYALFGCGAVSKLFLIPSRFLLSYLDEMWTTTTRDDRMYWHVKIEGAGNRYSLLLKKGVENPDVTEFLLANG